MGEVEAVGEAEEAAVGQILIQTVGEVGDPALIAVKAAGEVTNSTSSEIESLGKAIDSTSDAEVIGEHGFKSNLEITPEVEGVTEVVGKIDAAGKRLVEVAGEIEAVS